MENKFYQADEHRAERVQELFATIARRYDVLNDIMSLRLHRRWKRRLVTLALGSTGPGNEKSSDVLDLCCGTGDIAILFAERGVRVTGADFSEEMLQVANTRHDRRRELPVKFVRADALQLPFEDNAFDVVSVGYGLRNLADIEKGLREILRVLKPGGKFVTLDFGKPESKVFRSLYFGYLRVVLPILGWMFCGDPDTHGYILASLRSYPAQRGIEQLMKTMGYRECGFEEFCLGSMSINYGSKPV